MTAWRGFCRRALACVLKGRAGWLLVPGLLAACAHLAPDGAPCIDEGAFCLAPPRVLATESSLWALDVRRGDAQDAMLLDIESAPCTLQVVGLTPLGQKLVHLRYACEEGRAAPRYRLDTIALPRGSLVDAPTLLAAVQLAWWPREALAARLAPAWRIDEDAASRTVRDGAGLFARVEHANRAGEAAQVRVVFRDGLTVTMTAANP